MAAADSRNKGSGENATGNAPVSGVVPGGVLVTLPLGAK